MYYTYILRCSGGTLYTGITTDVPRRMREHFTKAQEGARYTKSHDAQRLEAVWESGSRSLASRLESRIKRLRKQSKERLISENAWELLGDGFDQGEYRRMEPSELTAAVSYF